jgi:hypothetical protein
VRLLHEAQGGAGSFEDALIGIAGKLVAAAGWGFDDDLEEAVFLSMGLRRVGSERAFTLAGRVDWG